MQSAVANSDTSSKIELGIIRDGYPSLAKWIARDPDHETYIFRRFDRLSARNILNLQSQLVDVEQRLDQLDEASRARRDVGLRRWETFTENAQKSKHPDDEVRMELYAELDEKIKSYQEALLRQKEMVNLKRPRKRSLLAFRDWFYGISQNAKPILSGGAQHFLDERRDLVALKTPADTDALSKIVQDHWPLRGHRPDPRDPTMHFQERHVKWAVAIISTITAALLLIGAIVTLYLVTKPVRRLVLIAAYTVLFALSVCLLTNARRAEMFAATAAYAAVLVVFVSGDLGGSNG